MEEILYNGKGRVINSLRFREEGGPGRLAGIQSKYHEDPLICAAAGGFLKEDERTSERLVLFFCSRAGLRTPVPAEISLSPGMSGAEQIVSCLDWISPL